MTKTLNEFVIYEAVGEKLPLIIESTKVPTKKAILVEHKVWSENTTLTPLSKDMASELAKRHANIRILVDTKWDPVRMFIASFEGKVESYNRKKDCFCLSSTSGPRTNIIDWYEI